jgi:hypothetical protein
VRVHLGHHFYGAGNLGDDFMLAGFLLAARRFAPDSSFTACVPFPLQALARRFPEVDWKEYDPEIRAAAIAECDIWLGLGGSPFQSSQSRWFLDHLLTEAHLCRIHRKPMYYLGIGAQSSAELADPDVVALCQQAVAIWTRDALSAPILRQWCPDVIIGADLAHIYFEAKPKLAPKAGQLTLVPNFDFGGWAGQNALLRFAAARRFRDRVWLAQESRCLPGAEHAIYARLEPDEKALWRLANADHADRSLDFVWNDLPLGEWVVTSRYHAALGAAWARSKVIVINTNDKLLSAATELQTVMIPPDADENLIADSFGHARQPERPIERTKLANAACRAFFIQTLPKSAAR